MTRSLAICVALLLGGCISLPYPHVAYHHSNISGRVVDRDTKQPIEGIAVRVADVTQITSSNGMFDFVPVPKQHYFYNVPLLPFEFYELCGDNLYFSDQDKGRTGAGTRYRSMSLKVDSCPYPAFGAFTREENLKKEERLGDVELAREQ